MVIWSRPREAADLPPPGLQDPSKMNVVTIQL
jgi:hypothetical protein